LDTREQGITARRVVGPFPKLFMRVCFRVFPPSRNTWRYYGTFGRFPNVLFPRRFTEKVQRRILFDRNPKLPLFADKLRTRGYVRAMLGSDRYLCPCCPF
jgi:hypothetical protein